MTPSCAPLPQSTAQPTATPPPTVNPPTPEVSFEDWLPVEPGLEARNIDLAGVQALLVRIDPTQLEVQLLYDPSNPRTVAGWNDFSGAVLTINAGFFEPDYTSSGLLIVSGREYGRSYAEREETGYRRSGVLTIDQQGASIHLVSTYSYPATQDIQFALEGFPLLIDNGAAVDFALPERRASRTVVALDTRGRLLLILVYDQPVTLEELQSGLLEISGELGITSALNLDGGPSSGVAITAGEFKLEKNSLSEVPIVLAVFQK